MQHWTEIRTAYHVGRLMTVSAAADHLGVHRATVIRHIDTLERLLGGRLFYRTTKGYMLTELGEDMMRVAEATDERFSQLMARAKGLETDVSGELVVTALEGLSPFVMPLLSEFRDDHGGLTVRFVATERHLQLEYGEAHVAFRAGPRPTQLDLVVQRFAPIKLGLYAHQDYAAAHGLPKDEAEFARHAFIAPEERSAPGRILVWYRQKVPEAAIVFKTNAPPVAKDAISSGLGIGFMPVEIGEADPHLIQVEGAGPRWQTPVWLVTHRDLHRSPKVQAFMTSFRRHRQESKGAVEQP